MLLVLLAAWHGGSVPLTVSRLHFTGTLGARQGERRNGVRSKGKTYFFLDRLLQAGIDESAFEKGVGMQYLRNGGVPDALESGDAAPSTWRLVERDFHNDNRLSWWLSHLSSPLDR